MAGMCPFNGCAQWGHRRLLYINRVARIRASAEGAKQAWREIKALERFARLKWSSGNPLLVLMSY